jgi:hypothetical protein
MAASPARLQGLCARAFELRREGPFSRDEIRLSRFAEARHPTKRFAKQPRAAFARSAKDRELHGRFDHGFALRIFPPNSLPVITLDRVVQNVARAKGEFVWTSVTSPRGPGRESFRRRIPLGPFPPTHVTGGKSVRSR